MESLAALRLNLSQDSPAHRHCKIKVLQTETGWFATQLCLASLEHSDSGQQLPHPGNSLDYLRPPKSFFFFKNIISYDNHPSMILTAFPQHYFNLFLSLLTSVMVDFTCITIISFKSHLKWHILSSNSIQRHMNLICKLYLITIEI